MSPISLQSKKKPSFGQCRPASGRPLRRQLHKLGIAASAPILCDRGAIFSDLFVQ